MGDTLVILEPEATIVETSSGDVVVTTTSETSVLLVANAELLESVSSNPDVVVVTSTETITASQESIVILTEAVQGPTGPQGIQGVPGADSVVPGPAGPTGPQGIQGVPGADGTNYLTPPQAAELISGGVTALHEHDFDHVTFPAANTIGTMSHVYTLSDMMNHIWSSGIVDGGVLTDNGNGTVSIALAIAAIRASTDPHGTIKGIEAAATLNISLSDNATNYLYLDYAAGTPAWAVTTNPTTANGLDKVLAYEIHRQGIVLHTIDRRSQTVDALRKINSLFASFAKFIHAEGGTVLGVSGLYLTVTAGLFYRGVEPISHVAFDTSVAGLANENTYVLWNHVAGVYTATEDVKLVSTTTWDNGTNSATLDNNKFGVSWVYIVNDSPSELHVVMGQAQYLKLADAIVATPPSTLPTLIDGIGSLIGFVAYEKGNTVFDGVFSAFATSFTPGLATQHNSLGGLQGGIIGEYYHLTAAEYAALGEVTGLPTVINTSASSYTPIVIAGDVIILCDTTSNSVTITMPTAVGNTAIYTIKKINAANTLTVDAAGTETIDGGITASWTWLDESITIVSDNANWRII